MRTFLLSSILCAAVGAAAVPVVSNVQVTQDEASRLVSVSYTLSGELSAVVTAWPTNSPPDYMIVDIATGVREYYVSSNAAQACRSAYRRHSGPNTKDRDSNNGVRVAYVIGL